MLTVAQRAVRVLCGLGFVVVMTGCASLSSVPLVGREAPEIVPGVVAPSERIAELRRLRDEAGSASPEEKQRVAAELAGQLAKEPDGSLRAEIVRTLAVYPTDVAMRILRHAIEDADVQVRIAVCEAWAQIGDAEAVRLLGATLDGDPDVDVRLAAAKALGRTGNPDAALALAPALADSDPAMQYRATLSLRRVTGKDFGTIAAWQQHLNRAYTPESRPHAVAERPRAAF